MRCTPGRAAAVAAAHFAVVDARRRLKAIRGGRSKRQLARELGVTHALLCRFEAGGPLPLALLFALGMRGVRLDWLVLGKGSPTFTKARLEDYTSGRSELDFEPWETVEL